MGILNKDMPKVFHLFTKILLSTANSLCTSLQTENNPPFDFSFKLIRPIIITSDRASTDIHMLADSRVAKIAEVRHVGVCANAGAIDFRACANINAFF